MSRYLCIAILAACGWLFSFEAIAVETCFRNIGDQYCYNGSSPSPYLFYTYHSGDGVSDPFGLGLPCTSVSKVVVQMLSSSPLQCLDYSIAFIEGMNPLECKSANEKCSLAPPPVPQIEGITTGLGAADPSRLKLEPAIGGWVIADDPYVPCSSYVTSVVEGTSLGIGGNQCVILSGLDKNNSLISVPSMVPDETSRQWNSATLPTAAAVGENVQVPDSGYGVGGYTVCLGSGCVEGGTGQARFCRYSANGVLREVVNVYEDGNVSRYLAVPSTYSGCDAAVLNHVTVAAKRTVSPSGQTSDYVVKSSYGTPASVGTTAAAIPSAVSETAPSFPAYTVGPTTLPLPVLASVSWNAARSQGSSAGGGSSSGGSSYSGGGPTATSPSPSHDPACGEVGQPACDAAGSNFPALTTDMFYTPKWAGFQAVYDAHKAAIDAVPALVKITSLKNLAFTPSNSCPKYSVDLPVVHGLTLGAFEFGLPCDAWPMMYTIMMITCGVISVVIFLKWG